MARSDDPFWVYVVGTTDRAYRCVYCDHAFGAQTSVTRIKLHLSGVKGRGVHICRKVPENVQEEAYQATEGANKRQKSAPSVQVPAPTAAPHQSLFGTSKPVLGAQQELGEERNFPSEVHNENTDLLKDIESRLMEGLDQTDSDPMYWHNLLRITEPNQRISTSLQAPTNEVAEASPSVQAPNNGAAEAAPFVQTQNIVVSEPASLQSSHSELMSYWDFRLLRIRGILDRAEEVNVKEEALKVCLSNLSDLAYDVDDIIDELKIEDKRSSLKHVESRAGSSIVQNLPTTILIDLQPTDAMIYWPKLQEIEARYERIMKEKTDLGLERNFKEMSIKQKQRLPSTSVVKESKVYGRDKVKEQLIEQLMSDEPSNSRYSVIPIVGMGGIGKTTLAQLVYDDERLKFDYRAWACVSDDFDIIRITKTILRCQEGNDLGELQEKLKKKLSGKKFFIVLDDIWSHNYEDWTSLCGPFLVGAPGSKVIITTRGEDVSLRLGSVGAYELEVLSDDDCLRLFAQHALDADSFDANQDLKEVGKQIISRCKGLPLAAKCLGGLLRHKKDLQEWEEISNSEIWELSEEESGIFSILRLSYHHLPSHLKRCFSYCAIFKKDYEFDEKELVWLWMAEGFLQKQETGYKYFKDLLSRSFFQQSSENKSRFVMHDYINDLAWSVSGERCFHLDATKQSGAKSYAKVRHSSFTPHRFDTSPRFEVFNEMEGLRTFMASRPMFCCNNMSNKVLDDLVPKLKRLRVLSLAGYYSLVELPSSINALKHLRYLDLSMTSIKKLPDSLGELFNLQTLRLCDCSQFMELPVWIDKLINLQHLDIIGTSNLQEMPLGVSKLKNLCFLSEFIVGKDSGLSIGELRHLPHLQGQLHITGLHNITNIYEANFANLKERKGVDELALEWSDYFSNTRNESQEKQVLNSLQPHQSLKKLSIRGYGGTEFPSWFGDRSFTKMVDLQLFNCCKVTSSLSLGKLPSLKILRIQGMAKLKEMVVVRIPSLETLHIEDMLELESISCSNGLDQVATGTFPKLCELTLDKCPKLIGKLPSCLPSLQKLVIFNCPQLTDLPEMLPSLRKLVVKDCDKGIFTNLPNFTSLRFLKIGGIVGLLNLQEAHVQDLVALTDLAISKCNDLGYLWQDGVGADKLTNLKHLRISCCKQLVSLVKGEEGLLPRNLQVLDLWKCVNLDKMPNGLQNQASLRKLGIQSCRKLVSFPEGACLPYSFKILEIGFCRSLELLPDGMMTKMNTDDNDNQCFLEELEIIRCQSLKSFPGGKLPTTLKKLVIRGCKDSRSEYLLVEGIVTREGRKMSNLEDLYLEAFSITSFPAGKFPTSLKTLVLYSCRKLQSLPSLGNLSHLTKLEICYCRELVSFGDEELSLPNLISLKIERCKKLKSLPVLPPKLMELVVVRCSNLRQPISEWRLYTLISLETLSIDFERSHYYFTSPVEDSFPGDEGPMLPTALTHLEVYHHKNLKSISSSIRHLTSLEELWIYDCPKLDVLPKEGFPSTLGFLRIQDCPIQEEECLKEGGYYWHIIPTIAKFFLYY